MDSSEYAKRRSARTEELANSGIDQLYASALASYELQIAQWPPDWGDYLYAVVHGNFKQIEEELHIKSLGISVLPEPLKGNANSHAVDRCKLKVQIGKSKSVEDIVDASRRINILLGCYTLTNWCQVGSSWRSLPIDGVQGATEGMWDLSKICRAIDSTETLSPEVQKKLYAALYWIREPLSVGCEPFQKSSILRYFSAFWNAFECLLGAMEEVCPRPSISSAKKQEMIEAFFEDRQHDLSAKNIAECYNSIVNKGIKSKAKHVFEAFMPDECDEYMHECFGITPACDRLYKIRNSINHGDFDAFSQPELIRVGNRFSFLRLIISSMFGKLVAYEYPVLSPLRKPKT